MSDPISAVTASTATPGSVPTTFANPGPEEAGGLSLSASAQDMLSRIGELQDSFTSEMSASQQPAEPGRTAAATPAETAPDSLAAAAEAVSEQITTSMRAQEQITHFVMASSVSSNFGNNLKMFLRGQ